MKTKILFIILVCVLSQVTLFGQEVRVLQKSNGSYIVESIENRDTGIRVENGLKLSDAQLEQVIKHGQVFLDEEKRPVSWSDFIHIKYEINSTKQAILEGRVIKVVNNIAGKV